MPDTPATPPYGEQLDFALIDESTPRLRVAKANALVEAQYQLTSKEHKLMLAAMAKIRKDQTELYEQVFNVADLADLLDFPLKSAYGELRRIAKGLMKKQVEVRDEVSGGWVMYQWVSKAYCSNGQFGIRFSDDLKPLLIGLVGRFTIFELGRVLKMRSGYSIRLYELFKQYESFGTRTFTLDRKLTANKNWEDFSRVMGYSPSSYPRFGNINQRIIKPAMKEVKALTEFKDIQVKTIKWQKKVIAVTFYFRSTQTLEDVEDHPLFTDVVKLGVTKDRAREIFAHYSDDRIEKNLNLVKVAHLARKIDNPAAYFVAAVTENYADPDLPLDDDSGKASSKKSGNQVQGDGVRKLSAEAGPDHPLYSACASDQDFAKLIAAERARGKPFTSYNEFHQFTLKKATAGG